MQTQITAGTRDIVLVTEPGHAQHGRRLVVISGVAGIGSRHIHAYAEDDHSFRTGLRHDHVEVVGSLHPTERMAHH